MHSGDRIAAALELGRHGLNASEISRRLGIPRATVREWLAGKTPKLRPPPLHEPPPARPYAYLLGQYLGDGCISQLSRSYCFTNHSVDIQVIFVDHLDLLGIAWRQQTWKTIAITRRADVARLDEFVGPKR